MARRKKSPGWLVSAVKDVKLWLILVGFVVNGIVYFVQLDMWRKKVNEDLEWIRKRLEPVSEDFSRRYAPEPQGGEP